jgi:protein-S-isoprenylcysteine O-methyltransferase Ste14
MAESLLSGETPEETAAAWAFVGVQFALIVGIVLLPVGDAWLLPTWADIAARGAQLLGVAVLLVAMLNLGTSLNALPLPSPGAQLKTGGLFSVVRHPIYSGLLLLAWATVARGGSWAQAACAAGLTALFAAKARYEETKLRARYPEYAHYASRVPRFVPGPWQRLRG